MSVIPQTLAGCRFNLVGKASKRAIEKDWPDVANYAIDDPKLLNWIENGGNYGVMAKNGVCVIDCDSEELWDAIPEAWKRSLVVKSGRDGPGGFHVYVRCPDAPAAKFVFGSRGDMRGPDSHFFVVGPGSIHEATNRRYEVLNDPGEIVDVSWDDLHAWIAAQEGEAEIQRPRNDAGTQKAIATGKRLSDECGLTVEEFLMPENPKRSGNEIFGVHPIHGSRTGHNLYINPSAGTWHCFRCNSGGDALLAFAVTRGIVRCEEGRPGVLNNDRIMSEILTQLEKEGRRRIYGEEIASVLLAGEEEPGETDEEPDNVAQARRVLKRLTKAAYGGQRGIAELYTGLYRGTYIFDASEQQWYRFGGVGWVKQTIAEQIKALDPIQKEIKNAAIAVDREIAEITEAWDPTGQSEKEIEAFKERKKRLNADSKALYAMDRNLSNLGFRKSCVEFAATSGEWLAITGNEWDRDPWVLGCANGVLDLRTGTLRPGAPTDYLQAVCPVPFNPEAKAPRWERFLLEIFDGDAEKVAYLKRLFGMTLIGDAAHKQYLVLLVGKGRNGKDTLLKVLNRVLGGDLCGKVGAGLLLDCGFMRSAGAPSPEIMGLRGKRLVYAAENGDGHAFDVARIKDLSGGADLTGRAPYGRFEVQFAASHMIVLETNTPPVADAADKAFWYRVRCIEFPLSFVPEPTFDNERKEEKGLSDALLAEAEGILAWLVAGCLEYQRGGLQDPPCVQVAAETYRRSMDQMRDFIDECCIESRQSSAGASVLYEAYTLWSRFRGLHPVTIQKFGRDLAAAGYIKEMGADGCMVYHGLRLR
ncbi:phage/plasmid primase, P4 family [Methanofollis tationis]|uniref:Bifunctional DNA primase/polymerase n=1 Tax=Methanofollis tationis TaxID=81417 RepID=A0A7K4HMB4_9EURY|nr:phage/plasmid primase, P4 family [Methanofollis tationis]NVO66406.1 bifunctional DNA primase/polymerase [Methanofollis tationis]